MSSAVSAVTSASDAVERQTAKRCALRACTASRRFSCTDSPPNRLVIWNERPTPAAVMLSGLSPAIERPSSVMVPRSGG